MRRFRLSTLLLLIVIAALVVALVVQNRREAELQARLAQSWPVFKKKKAKEELLRVLEMEFKRKREERTRSSRMWLLPEGRTTRLRPSNRSEGFFA